ncbi:MAG: DUF4097 family beta strand repeat protein [Oscillospiraceae bacterium]|nr:DUF4097 family beta strand repeat protein [Oscillospiraceae bacterium]
MRRTTIWLVTAAALILVGAGGLALAMALSNGDFSQLSTTSYETKTVDITEQFRDISLRTGEEDVLFVPSADGACRVVFRVWEKVSCTAAVEDSALRIETQDGRSAAEKISVFSMESPSVTVYLPRADYGALLMEGSTGDVEMDAEHRFERAEISAGTGDVNWKASLSGALRIELSTGDIRLDGISAGELALSVSTGGVNLHSVNCRGGITIGVSTGKASLSNVRCRSLRSAGSTGDIRLEDLIAEEGISVERSTGDVELRGCDAAELFIKTSTGDVSGSLLSPKRYVTHSDTGRVEIPESFDGGKCEIRTTTGNILLRED